MKPSAPSRSLARRTLSHAAAVLSLLALPAALDAQSGSNPSPNYAAAFPFGGRVATDLRFSEWFFNDHTVMLRFMPQYPTGYQGPILTNDPKSPGATYSVGLANYQAGGVSATKLVVRIGTREQFYRTPLKRGQWYHLAVRRSKGRIDVFLDGQAFPLPPAQPFVVPATGLPAPSAPLIIGRRLLDPAPAVLWLRGRRSDLQLRGEQVPDPGSDEQHPAGSAATSTACSPATPSTTARQQARRCQARSIAGRRFRAPRTAPSSHRTAAAQSMGPGCRCRCNRPYSSCPSTTVRTGASGRTTAQRPATTAISASASTCTARTDPRFGQPIRAAATGQVVRADSGAIRPGGYEVHVEHGSRGEHSEYVHGLGHYIIAFVGALGGVFPAVQQPAAVPVGVGCAGARRQGTTDRGGGLPPQWQPPPLGHQNA